MVKKVFGAYLVLITGFIISCFAAWHTYSGIKGKQKLLLNSEANQTGILIQERMNVYRQALQDTAAVWSANGNIDEERLEAFTSTQKTSKNLQGLSGVGFLKLVKESELAEHISSMRAAGIDGYSVQPLGKRKLYAPIIHLEPHTEQNKARIGFDALSDTVRATAIHNALKTREASISGKLPSQEGKPQASYDFLMYAPVYSKVRQDDIDGFVYFRFKAANLIRGILGAKEDVVGLQIYDTYTNGKSELLYDSHPNCKNKAVMSDDIKLDMYGHTWILKFKAHEEFFIGYGAYMHLVTLAVGMLVSLLLFGFVRALLAAKESAERLLEISQNAEDEQQALNEELEATNKELEMSFGALEAERNKIQQVVDEIPNMILIKDDEYKYVFVNQALCDFLQIPQKELLGKTVFDILPPDEAEPIWKNEKLLVESGSSQILEETITDAAGKAKTLLVTKKPLSTYDGGNGLLVVLTDITQRKEMENTLKESEDKFRTIFESSHDAIMLQSDSSFIDCNQRALELFGIADKKELTRYSPADLSPDIQPNGEKSTVAADRQIQIAKDTGSSHFEWESRRLNGELFQSDVSLSTFEYKGKQIIQATVRDITQAKLDQKKIEEQERMIFTQSRFAAMGEMIGMIAHQWRQPITAIGMGANNMTMDIELGDINADVFKKHLDSINTQVQFLSNTIDDFRNFFRPNKSATRISVSELVGGALKIIGKSLENNAVEVRKEIGYDPMLDVYESELIQALLAIIGNAKDAMVERGVQNPVISLTTVQNPEFQNSVELYICDNGGGVPQEIMERIFEPYFTTKSAKNGTGLGLYIAKTIIEKHQGGSIGVRNEDVGACFWIRLPISKQW